MQQKQSNTHSVQLTGCGWVTAISSTAEGLFLCLRVVRSLNDGTQEQEWHLRCQVKEDSLCRWVMALPFYNIDSPSIELAFTVTDVMFCEQFSSQGIDSVEIVLVMDAVLTKARRL
ncbi:MAG: hypothetical protein GKR77_05380 [Legionellales bacterium]|nr:hypothetical protein [Legionellales bacterium]